MSTNKDLIIDNWLCTTFLISKHSPYKEIRQTKRTSVNVLYTLITNDERASLYNASGQIIPNVVEKTIVRICIDDIAKEYINRVDRVDSSDQRYGLASLNLTKVTEKDRGWYNCKVLFLDRGPDAAVVSFGWVTIIMSLEDFN